MRPFGMSLLHNHDTLPRFILLYLTVLGQNCFAALIASPVVVIPGTQSTNVFVTKTPGKPFFS